MSEVKEGEANGHPCHPLAGSELDKKIPDLKLELIDAWPLINR
jgi:hypothetical protein